MKLRLGVIGLGDNWECRHWPALASLAQKFEVRAVYDTVAHRAAAVAHQVGGQAVEGFTALIHRRDVDAVLWSDPEWHGILPLEQACRAGKPTYCSPLPRLDIQQAEQLAQIVRQQGCRLMLEFAHRAFPVTVRLKELLATRLGEPRLLFCEVRRANPPTAGLNPDLPFAEQLALLADWCRYCVGRDPTSLQSFVRYGNGPDTAGESHANTAVATQPPTGQTKVSSANPIGEPAPGMKPPPSAEASSQPRCPDYQCLLLDFSPPEACGEGPLAQVRLWDGTPRLSPEAHLHRAPATLQVICENGTAFLDPPSEFVWFDADGRHGENLSSERPVGQSLLEQFYLMATEGTPPIAGIDDLIWAMRLIRAAALSHQHGRREPLPTL